MGDGHRFILLVTGLYSTCGSFDQLIGFIRVNKVIIIIIIIIIIMVEEVKVSA